MRYRGGGIGHKYMRDVKKKYENMSLERVRGNACPKPSHKDRANTNKTTNGGPGMDQSKPNEDESSSDEGCTPSERSPGTDCEDPLHCDGDSVGHEDPANDEDFAKGNNGSDYESRPVDSEADFDEVGSDGGYKSFGFADL